MIAQGILLQRGTQYPRAHPIREIVAKLLDISTGTVKRYLAEENAIPQDDHMKEPVKRGRKKMTTEQAREKWSGQFKLISDKILECRKNGEVLTIHKLAVYLKEENNDFDYTYGALRYYLVRMGFRYGKISKTFKSARCKPYIIDWAKRYCIARIAALEQGKKGERMDKVDAFLDETWMYQNASGGYSWYLDDKTWFAGRGAKNRWCIGNVVLELKVSTGRENRRADGRRVYTFNAHGLNSAGSLRTFAEYSETADYILFAVRSQHQWHVTPVKLHVSLNAPALGDGGPPAAVPRRLMDRTQMQVTRMQLRVGTVCRGQGGHERGTTLGLGPDRNLSEWLDTVVEWSESLSEDRRLDRLFSSVIGRRPL
jgi:hypothetical protein